VTNKDASQEIVIVAPIPAEQSGKSWQTLDLWARDVNAQAKLIRITIICPVSATYGVNLAPLDSSIRIVSESDLIAVRKAVQVCTFVQIPGNFGYHGARVARKVLRLARIEKKPVFLGISSDRARTTILNNRNRNVLRRLIAQCRAADIRFTQRRLAKQCHGVFVVGHGISHLVEGSNSNIYISTASWVSREDVNLESRPPSRMLNICMAGRLELMKGFHIGLDAIALLPNNLPCNVTIIGDGSEQKALSDQANRLKIKNLTLRQSVPYPEPFYAVLDKQDLILLTNLNDEQPRLVFDSIYRGAIPICPKSQAYVNLGLDARLMYERGNARDLSDCIYRLQDYEVRKKIGLELKQIARLYTIEEMHERRLDWMIHTTENKTKVESN